MNKEEGDTPITLGGNNMIETSGLRKDTKHIKTHLGSQEHRDATFAGKNQTVVAMGGRNADLSEPASSLLIADIGFLLDFELKDGKYLQATVVQHDWESDEIEIIQGEMVQGPDVDGFETLQFGDGTQVIYDDILALRIEQRELRL